MASDEFSPSDEPPVEILADLALGPDPAFGAKVRDSIRRRETAGRMADLWSSGFFAVVLEFLALADRVVAAHRTAPAPEEEE